MVTLGSRARWQRRALTAASVLCLVVGVAGPDAPSARESAGRPADSSATIANPAAPSGPTGARLDPAAAASSSPTGAPGAPRISDSPAVPSATPAATAPGAPGTIGPRRSERPDPRPSPGPSAPPNPAPSAPPSPAPSTDRPESAGPEPAGPEPADPADPADPAPPGAAPAGAAPPGTAPTGAAPAVPQVVEGAALRPTVGLAVIGVSQIEPGSVDRASIDLTATYRVEATLGWTSRKLTVSTAISVLNTSGGPIDRLELNTIAARLGGGMIIDRVTVDGRPGTSSVDDQTITVPLGGILPEGKRTLVQVVYRATLRSNTSGSNWLFTKANGVANLYRWIPWVSRPVAFDRPNHGDPFVTPVSPRVQVTLIADEPLVVATGGHETATEDGGRRRTFVATDVRDLALTAAPDYQLTSSIVDGVIVKVYSRAGDPASTYRNEARLALQRFAPLVGPYPWTSLTVARSGGGFAMESPGMVWIPPGAGSLAYLVHHEIAHQWFYGLVGNDQTDEPFADEAATDFLTRYVLGLRRASRCSTDDLDDPIYAYSEACYYEVIYIQGGNFLDDLRKQVGSSAFWTGVRTYVDEHRFRFGGTKALLDAIDLASALDLVPTFQPRFDRYY